MTSTASTLLLLAAGPLAGLASAQTAPSLAPFARNLDAYVTDSTADVVWRLQDTNYDGDFDDAGEVVLFYDQTQGTVALGNNSAIEVLPDGTVIVSDSTTDVVLALRDLDGDGACHGPNEHWVWFDGNPGGNGSNVEMTSAQNMAVDVRGRVFVASANTSSGVDAILLLEDRNGDGDSNDAGEARHYFEPFSGSATGDSIPNSVGILPDGSLLHLEGGTTGVNTKGIFRLVDLDGSGDIDPFTEVFVFWLPPLGPSNPFIWDFEIDRDGVVWCADTSNDHLWRLDDQNGDFVIDNTTTEELLAWSSTSGSLIWSLRADEYGDLLVAESQSPDRILRLADTNGDGLFDPATEVFEVYSELVSPTNIENPRGLCLRRAPGLVARPNGEVGGGAALVVTGSVGEPVRLLGSLAATAPVLVAPIGELELDTSAAFDFFRTSAGRLGRDGRLFTVLEVPSDPALVGATLHLQALVGFDGRRALTERVTVALN